VPRPENIPSTIDFASWPLPRYEKKNEQHGKNKQKRKRKNEWNEWNEEGEEEDDDVEKQSTNGSTKLNQDEFTFFDEEEEDGQHYDEEETKGLLG